MQFSDLGRLRVTSRMAWSGVGKVRVLCTVWGGGTVKGEDILRVVLDGRTVRWVSIESIWNGGRAVRTVGVDGCLYVFRTQQE